MECKTSRDYFTFNNQEWVCGSNIHSKRSTLASLHHLLTIQCLTQSDNSVLRQSVCNCTHEGAPIPHAHKAYWYSISFYLMGHWRQKIVANLLSYWGNGDRPTYEGTSINQSQTFCKRTQSCSVLRRSVGVRRSWCQGCRTEMQHVQDWYWNHISLP